MNLVLRKIYYPLINIRKRAFLSLLKYYYYDILSHAYTLYARTIQISL